jgi:hypothetical protein
MMIIGIPCLNNCYPTRKGMVTAMCHRNMRRIGLGLWVSNQRQSRRKGILSEDRIAKLDSIGFMWDSHDDNWNSMFEQLLSYKKRNGDCNVPLRI